MEFGGPALGHTPSPTGRCVRARPVRTPFWIAVAEGILIVVHAISWWATVLVAALVVGGWFSLGHRLGSDTLRQGGGIAAVSQALVALVPILVLVVGTLALILVALLAAVALILLFSSRE